MKSRLTIWAVVIFLCTGRSCLAQQRIIRSYTIEDGLVNNDVLRIRQDGRGFIWICTRGGLSRYDGIRFTNYTTSNGLTNDMINDIVEIAPQKFIVAQNSNGPRLLEKDQIKELEPKNTITVNRFFRTASNELMATTDDRGIVTWKNNAFRPLDREYTAPVSEVSILNDSLWAIIINDVSLQLTTNRLKPWSALKAIEASIVYTDTRHRTWVPPGG